jgi:hypothetical protein
MKNLYKLIVLSGMALFLGSCYYDTYPEEEALPLPEEVSYSEDIQPLWDRDCVRCHPPSPPILTEGLSRDALINGNYVIPGDSRNSSLYKSFFGLDGVSEMPPGGWNINDANLVAKWIDDGAQDN